LIVPAKTPESDPDVPELDPEEPDDDPCCPEVVGVETSAGGPDPPEDPDEPEPPVGPGPPPGPPESRARSSRYSRFNETVLGRREDRLAGKHPTRVSVRRRCRNRDHIEKGMVQILPADRYGLFRMRKRLSLYPTRPETQAHSCAYLPGVRFQLDIVYFRLGGQ
jgi:hypothetical protein